MNNVDWSRETKCDLKWKAGVHLDNTFSIDLETRPDEGTGGRGSSLGLPLRRDSSFGLPL